MDENLEVATIGSFKIYEDQEDLKADMILAKVAKRLFEEDTFKIKVAIERITTICLRLLVICRRLLVICHH